MLLTGWHPTAPCRLASHRSSSLSGTASAGWLYSPTSLSLSCDVLYGREPHLGYDGSSYCTRFLAHSKRRCAATFQSLPTAEPAPQPDFTVCVLGLGILAILVVSSGFFDFFLSVTWWPAEGFGSHSCTSLRFVSLHVWGISILGARRGGFFLWIRGV